MLALPLCVARPSTKACWTSLAIFRASPQTKMVAFESNSINSKTSLKLFLSSCWTYLTLLCGSSLEKHDDIRVNVPLSSQVFQSQLQKKALTCSITPINHFQIAFIPKEEIRFLVSTSGKEPRRPQRSIAILNFPLFSPPEKSSKRRDSSSRTNHDNGSAQILRVPKVLITSTIHLNLGKYYN